MAHSPRFGAFLDVSPYGTRPEDLQPTLDGDARADVVVVGAGYTGLSTALALKRAGADVVVLERDFAGYGSSGRNAGHLTPTIGKDLPTLLTLFGEQRATALVHFADAAVRATEQLIADHHIDCDYLASGNIMAVVHPKQEPRLRKAAAVAGRVGAHVRFLDADEMRARGVPAAFLSGALEEAGGGLHPGKFVRGLRRVAIDTGVRLHEQTVVQEIVDAPRPQVRTATGTVAADHVVLATNAYTVELGRFGRKILPLYDTLFETVPLSDAQLSALGWPGREGIYTAHETLESYRLTADRTIIGGSKAVRYPYGSKLRGGPSSTTQRAIERAFRDRFPELHGLPIAHFWGGWIAMTLHFLPAVGRTGRHRNIHYAIGYNGHGLAQGVAMGPILADMVLGRPNPHADVVSRFVPPLPPEPLRWLVVNGLMRFFDWIDARVDRELRGAHQGREPSVPTRN